MHHPYFDKACRDAVLIAFITAPLAACRDSRADDVADAVPAAVAPPVAVADSAARLDSVVRSRPGFVVDSILPVDEQIRRFQASAGERPARLSNGARTREALVAEFVRAVERADTSALMRLVVDRAEFAYLVYPTSPNAAPPYRQAPEIVWLTRSASTSKSARRLLARFGGRPVPYAGFACSDSVTREGLNTLWTSCAVKLAPTPGDTTSIRLFGPIVERGGGYKFLSLTNGF